MEGVAKQNAHKYSGANVLIIEKRAETFFWLTGSNQRMLIQQLRELESDEIVNRKVYSQVPPKVEYSLSAHGKSLIPLINTLSNWGIKHVEKTFPKRSIEYKTMCSTSEIMKNEGRYKKRTKPI